MSAKKVLSVLMMLLIITALTVGCARAPQEEKLVMGFVPMRDAETLIESVKPLAELLSKELGVKVEAFTALNYVGVVEGLGSARVDFGFIPPFGYVLANNESKAKVVLTALRKDGLAFYKSQFIVHKDSGITSLEELRGKTVAFVDPTSSSGYLFPGALLKDLGIDLDKDITAIFAGGHDKALQAVLNKDVDAAAVFVDARTRYAADFPTAMDDAIVIGYTDPIPNISVTVSSQVSDEMAEKIAVALLKIAEDPEDAKLLIDLFDMHGFVRSTDADYQVIRDVARYMDVDLRDGN